MIIAMAIWQMLQPVLCPDLYCIFGKGRPVIIFCFFHLKNMITLDIVHNTLDKCHMVAIKVSLHYYKTALYLQRDRNMLLKRRQLSCSTSREETNRKTLHSIGPTHGF